MIQQTQEVEKRPASSARSDGWNPGQFVIALVGLAVVFVLLWLGFLYLRGTKTASVLNAIIAIVWGVGGVAAVFGITNAMIEALPTTWRNRILPFLFFMPGITILFLFLTIPTLITLYQSFFNNDTTQFVGLQNYIATFTDRSMLESFRNNLLWMVFGTALCVGMGLLIAVMVLMLRLPGLVLLAVQVSPLSIETKTPPGLLLRGFVVAAAKSLLPREVNEVM